MLSTIPSLRPLLPLEDPGSLTRDGACSDEVPVSVQSGLSRQKDYQKLRVDTRPEKRKKKDDDNKIPKNGE